MSVTRRSLNFATMASFSACVNCFTVKYCFENGLSVCASAKPPASKTSSVGSPYGHSATSKGTTVKASAKLGSCGIFSGWCLGATAVVLSAQTLTVSAHTLSNGMRLCDPRGSRLAQCGHARVLQNRLAQRAPGRHRNFAFFRTHDVSNGAGKYGPKQFDIQMNGGSNNGFTTNDSPPTRTRFHPQHWNW